MFDTSQLDPLTHLTCQPSMSTLCIHLDDVLTLLIPRAYPIAYTIIDNVFLTWICLYGFQHMLLTHNLLVSNIDIAGSLHQCNQFQCIQNIPGCLGHSCCCIMFGCPGLSEALWASPPPHTILSVCAHILAYLAALSTYPKHPRCILMLLMHPIHLLACLGHFKPF